MQGSPTTGHDEVQTLQFHRYESAAGRVRPRWSLRNDHNIFGYGHGIEGSKQYECTHWANVQWTLWQVCNPCHSLYPMFQLCIIKTSTAVNPNFFLLFWSRPHLLLEVNSLQMQIGLACAWGAALGSLDSSAPPRLLSFIFWWPLSPWCVMCNLSRLVWDTCIVIVLIVSPKIPTAREGK